MNYVQKIETAILRPKNRVLLPYLGWSCKVLSFCHDKIQKRLRGLVGDGLFESSFRHIPLIGMKFKSKSFLPKHFCYVNQTPDKMLPR